MLVEQAVGVGLGQHRHQRRRRDELHVVILTDGLSAQGDRQMGLARARRPQEQECVAVCDPPAGRQFPDLLLIQ